MKSSEIIARVREGVFTHSGPISAPREGLKPADSVEKVGHGFHGRKLRA
jgi:hypothetical protein